MRLGDASRARPVHRLPQTQQVCAFTLLLTWVIEQQHWGRNTAPQPGEGEGEGRASDMGHL